MFVEERQGIILELLEENGKVKVKELSERFEVTEDCIRKDLASMEKRGLLQRAYGGAVRNKVNVHNLHVSQRIDKNIEEKKVIAQKAIKLIKDGDMIFLDISTANIELAKLLAQSDLSITVVTNMIEVMRVLAVPCSVNLIFAGGTFNRSRDGFTGALTISNLINFRFDIAFMGAVGINAAENSVETYMTEDGMTKKSVVDHSTQKYVVAENEKFNMYGTYSYASVSDFTGIITDKEPENYISKQLKKHTNIL